MGWSEKHTHRGKGCKGWELELTDTHTKNKMKRRIFLRIAKTGRARGGFLVDASKTPKSEPLTNNTSGPYKKFFPTVRVALDLDIPDSMFDDVQAILTAKIKMAEPCIEISSEDII